MKLCDIFQCICYNLITKTIYLKASSRLYYIKHMWFNTLFSVLNNLSKLYWFLPNILWIIDLYYKAHHVKFTIKHSAQTSLPIFSRISTFFLGAIFLLKNVPLKCINHLKLICVQLECIKLPQFFFFLAFNRLTDKEYEENRE